MNKDYRQEKGAEAKFCAVILAAGYSSRMGDFKPLLPVGGIPAVQRLMESVSEAGIREIIVVTGHNRDALSSFISRYDMEKNDSEKSCCCDANSSVNIHEAFNPDYEQGMFTSVQTGILKAEAIADKKDIEGCFLMPVDCPLISKNTIEALQSAVSEIQQDNFTVPVFRGKKGHPLYIPMQYAPEICAHDGNGGLKSITDKYHQKFSRIPVDEEGCILDMDTPKGYEEIQNFLAEGCKRRNLRELAAGKRIFLVRHGETKQHKEKMFIGQYDVPLSEAGKKQAEDAAVKIERFKPDAPVVYCSDLARAAETAEIISSRLGIGNCLQSSDLREINLGEWDGRPISEIKERYPVEYEMRGRDMFTFKLGNKAENFYDLQYRTVKAMREILETESARDIIIVSHSGVIRALENNLKGLSVDDDWGKLSKGGFKVIEC